MSQHRRVETPQALTADEPAKETGAARSERRPARTRREHPWGALIAMLLLTALGLATMGLFSFQGHTAFSPKLALDLKGGTQMILTPQTIAQGKIDENQLNQAVQIIRQRVDGAGVSEAEITTQNGRNVVVSMPDTPSEETRRLIQASANMEFRPVIEVGEGAKASKPTPDKQIKAPSAAPANASDPNWITKDVRKAYEAKDCNVAPSSKDKKDSDPAKPLVACDPETHEKFILGPVEVPGSMIKTASASLVQGSGGTTTGQWGVDLEFTSEGTAAFKKVTERLTKLNTSDRGRFAIVLDGQVLSAPMSQAVISDGEAQITGSFTEESSKALSEQLRYGALPISFSIDSEQQISATLGQEQLKMGIIAGLIGLALVAVYSFFQYRMLGLVTLGSLIVAGLITWIAICILGVTANYRLSLAGVAGIIVAIGLTADSFIVYFERIRDELREGRTLRTAVAIGWERARRTILASKAVNLLAAVVLFVAAVGSVRGFAFTLGLTAIADLVVVFLFTHPVLQLLARRPFFADGHPASGLDPRALGAVPLYRGAGRIREPENADGNDGPAAPEGSGSSAAAIDMRVPAADSGMTIAERRRAQRLAEQKEGERE